MLDINTIDNAELPESGRVILWDYSGLGLRISHTGSKSWIFFYRYQARLRRITFGRYPDISLNKARELRDRAKIDLKNKIDPRTRHLEPNRLKKDLVQVPRYLLEKLYKGRSLKEYEQVYIVKQINK